MTDTAEHGVIGPNGERVFAFFLQLLGIMDHHLLAVFGGNTKLRREGGVERPFAIAEFGNMNIGVGCGVVAILIHKEDGVEDLHGLVRIHGGGDVGDIPPGCDR